MKSFEKRDLTKYDGLTECVRTAYKMRHRKGKLVLLNNIIIVEKCAQTTVQVGRRTTTVGKSKQGALTAYLHYVKQQNQRQAV